MTVEDREKTIKDRQNPTHPLHPQNSNVQWAFNADDGAIDIYWDDPAQIPNNNGFDVVGVNIYRSFDSEYGPFYKLNQTPLGATYYRDETKSDSVVDEDVSSRFLSEGEGDDETGRWVFRVKNFPVVKPDDPNTHANHPEDVTIKIDGTEVNAARVHGETGEVVLTTASTTNVIKNEVNFAELPKSSSTVTCSYSYNTNLISNDLYQRTFYRLTTVGVDDWDGVTKETPLKWTDSLHIQQNENMSYIWSEAVRRNKWILEQGGERALAFIHKKRGVECGCYQKTNDPHPRNRCEICFGTGVKGGYEGPYEILIAPSDSDRSINQSERGRFEEKSDDVWTGPRPLLSQRDFVVKMNGDRYSIGPVRMPTNRGNVLQQHFPIGLLDKDDIRYEVPVTGTDSLSYPETRTDDHEDPDDQLRNPQITDKEEVADGIEERGRTPVWENIYY